MLVFISSIIIVAYTIYFCIHTAAKKQYVSSMTGKCISMSLGMVSSTIVGLLLALLLPGELAYTTVLSIAVSSVLAYFIGKLFGVSGIIEAMSASFMGAMMGAMLGDMMPGNRVVFMVIAMDIIYLLSVLSLMIMVNKMAVKENPIKGTNFITLFLSFVLSLSIIGLVATIGSGALNFNDSPDMNHMHHQ
ncbi:hypothetical protein J7E63_26620 [Bacillus sp. ISL-75]|uniref:hypothetical protein n=1 Tax=Bacillus sp. ISL-75 TaxID=2819137 RepID=UPI001BE566AB|nr:hypothetical protein [Bacillus sp. ISL-75]MBT2730410.1 hypothetical protein [Bacillus sp. ISL-75]